MRLLLLEGAPDAGAWLVDRLRGNGFKPRLVTDADEALRLAPDVEAMIVDVDHAGCSASAFIEPLRLAGVEKPVLVLSARGDWRDRVETLDAGADDYVVKPIRSEEVAARLRAIIRRASGSSTSLLVRGPLACDLRSRTITLDEVPLDLTHNEFRLLRLLMLRAGRILPPNEIHGQLYGAASDRSANAIEVQIARLRKKVGSQAIQTVRGMGYRLAILWSDAQATAA